MEPPKPLENTGFFRYGSMVPSNIYIINKKGVGDRGYPYGYSISPPYKSYYIGDFNGTTEPMNKNSFKTLVNTAFLMVPSCAKINGTDNGTDGTGGGFPLCVHEKGRGIAPPPG